MIELFQITLIPGETQDILVLGRDNDHFRVKLFAKIQQCIDESSFRFSEVGAINVMTDVPGVFHCGGISGTRINDGDIPFTKTPDYTQYIGAQVRCHQHTRSTNLIANHYAIIIGDLSDLMCETAHIME
jgi:hypothetical protein